MNSCIFRAREWLHNELHRRRIWVQLYVETEDAGLVCRRCGISRPTLRLWWERFVAKGDAGLVNLSRRPHQSPARVLDEQRNQFDSCPP
jgi:hypothetical protein